jgi:cysteine/O-acetylserine efflux protein
MANFYPFLAYVLVTTFTPGPNNILSMSNGLKHGYQRTLKFLCGVFSGFLIVMLLCGLLNVFLVRLLPQIEHWMKLAGALYMLYLAFHIVFSKPVENDPAKNNLNTFLAGFSLQFLNLKVLLYGVTVFSTFIVQSFQNPLQVSLFAPLLAGTAFIATSCWAIGGGLFHGLLKRHIRLFNLAMGALLILTAIASIQ